MEPFTKFNQQQTSPFVSQLVILWSRHGQQLLQLGIGLMIVAALWRLEVELPKLIWGQGEFDAVDLISRHREVERWFAGLPVYGAIPNGDYPPASYPLLWPWIGWLSREATRWFWAITTLLMLAWLGWLGMRESYAATFWEKAFIVLIPFALYPAGTGIRVGQVTAHLMAPLVLGLLLMRRAHPHPKWGRDLLAAALFLFALVKPTVSAPFFWVVCFMPGRWLPVLMVSVGYGALALLAVQYQEGNLLTLHLDWLNHASTQLDTIGHASVHTWLEAAGLSDWMLPVSLLFFGVAGIWTAIYRRSCPWILLSVAAMVARFWVDHQVFDDLLLWIPLIALFRLTQLEANPWVRITAAILFALNWLLLMVPARFFNDNYSLSSVAVPVQTTLWFIVLVFFMVLAHRDMTQETA